MKKITTILMLLMLTCMGAWADASQGIQLTFNKSAGGNASPGNVAVVVTDMDGNATNVQATLNETSFTQFKTGSAAALSRTTNFAIVPSSYGNSVGATIEYTFEITGLPSGFTYNNVAIDVYACKGDGSSQLNNGTTDRDFDFFVSTGATKSGLATFVEQEDNNITTVPGPQDGGLYHKLWNMKAANTGTATDGTLWVKVVLKNDNKGANVGCFAGIGKVQIYGYFDFTENVNTDIKPWVASIGNGYFTLDSSNEAVLALQTAYNAHTAGETWSEAEYNTLLSLLNTAKASGIKMPENGYYRLKANTVSGRPEGYIGYSQTTLPKYESRGIGLRNIAIADAATDASTILKLTQVEGGYKISTEGLYVKDQETQSQLFPVTNVEADAAVFVISAAAPKLAFIGTATNSKQWGLHNSEWNAIVGWTAGDASYWLLEDATTLELPLTAIGDKNYATTCLPFPVKLSEEAAYKVTLSGKKAVEELIGDEIPANTPVLLMSDASTKLTATIQDVTTTVSGNDLKGVLVKTAKADLQGDIPVVLNQKSGKVGFYKLAEGSSLSANRAYLSYVEGTTPPSSKAFFEEGFELGGNEATAIENVENGAFENGAVYNLQGQRVNKAQKGVFIQNGKKVVLK